MADYPEGFPGPGLKTEHPVLLILHLKRTKLQSCTLDSQEGDADMKFGATQNVLEIITLERKGGGKENWPEGEIKLKHSPGKAMVSSVEHILPIRVFLYCAQMGQASLSCLRHWVRCLSVG